MRQLFKKKPDNLSNSMKIFSGIVQRLYWPSGPWDSEPDLFYWKHSQYSCICLGRRQPLGYWCGYVSKIPGYNHIEYAPVHGGITFGGVIVGLKINSSLTIDHPPHTSEKPKKIEFIGFDCGHHRDLYPYHLTQLSHNATYKDCHFTIKEINKLADLMYCPGCKRDELETATCPIHDHWKNV